MKTTELIKQIDSFLKGDLKFPILHENDTNSFYVYDTDTLAYRTLLKGDISTLINKLKRYEEALSRILRIETVDWRKIHSDPYEWKTAHELVKDAALKALEEE